MDRPFVAFSCGKDSSVLAHLVLEQRPGTPLRFLSSGETRLIHNVDEIIGWFQGLGAQVDEINIDRVFSPEWQHASWNEQRKAGRGDLDKLNIGDWDAVFIGLRAEESSVRRLNLYGSRTEGLPPFCYRYKSGVRESMIRIAPLARWTTRDVAAYIHTNQIPLLREYREMGVQSRTTARLTGDAVRQGALARLRMQDPRKWQILVDRFPELKAFC